MQTAEFLNRTEELAVMKRALQDRSAAPALFILRAPQGFGKSSLTTRLAADLMLLGYRYAIVDPQMRTDAASRRLHDGYYLQQCALALTETRGTEPVFDEFLRSRRWKTARNKSVLDSLRQMPSPDVGYSAAFEYLERLFGFGRYSASSLLSSDQAEAVAIAREYVWEATSWQPTVLIVRETQSMDSESLRTLLQFNAEEKGPRLVLEYTSADRAFASDHQKLVEAVLTPARPVSILDLMQLEKTHFETLVGSVFAGEESASVRGDFYARWDGNIRSLKEARFRVALKQDVFDVEDLRKTLEDFGPRLTERIDGLSSAERFILAVVAAHGEQISENVLLDVVGSVHAGLDEEQIKSLVAKLVNVDRLLSRSNIWLGLADDNVAGSLPTTRGHPGQNALAERLLRDYFLHCFSERDFSDISAGLALRQAFRLCARTGESRQLIRLLTDFQDLLRRAADPGKYLDILVEVLREADLLGAERRRIEDHAINLAYDIGDFRTAASLLAARGDKTRLHLALEAQCNVEIGRLDAAELYSESVKGNAGGNEALHGLLVDAGVALVRNRWDQCRHLIDRATSEHMAGGSPLIGHAYRLLESTQDYPECIETALAGVSWYGKTGRKFPLAFAELAAARHLARAGRIDEATKMLNDAAERLDGQIQDPHILWNAKAAIGMLREKPDFSSAADALRRGLTSVRDDFSELVVRSNLAIARWKLDDMDIALAQVEACLRILNAPEFSDRHVFWPICYNLSQILSAADQSDRARDVRALALALPFDELNPRQWSYRYGLSAEPDPETPYLQGFDYYPTFLSHWQVEREVLATLSEERDP